MSHHFHPSRILTDLLSIPHPNTPPYLLAIANESLSDLYNTQVTTRQAHSEARKRFVIARAWFEVKAKVARTSGEGEKRDLERAQEMYDQAWSEMEARRGELERCNREIGGLKGDVAFLTQLIEERQSGNVHGTNGRGTSRGPGSPRMLGEKKHTRLMVLGDPETGRDSGVGFAM